ncbi:terpene synthase family protein [Streptomyces sp. NPDC002104]
MTSPAHPVDFGIPVLQHIHPEADRVGQSLDAWAVRVGLAGTPAERARMRAAGFHLIASRILHDVPVEAAELFARWVTLLFHLDDQQDEGPMGRSAEEVKAVYRALTSIVDAPPASVISPTPAVTAFADLWPRTADGLSAAWRRRFRSHLLGHRDAFLAQIAHREDGTVPTCEGYPGLRRDANGMFMFDLVEAALRTEVPAALAEGALWREMCEASNDLTAWCNDILSHSRETAAGEVTNYVIVLEQATGCDTGTALGLVLDRIRDRHHRLAEVRAELAEPLAALPAPLRGAVAYIADAMCVMPGTQLAWLAESGRYPDLLLAESGAQPGRG